MKIAIYTLTRDRLDYTRHCFGRLWACAGHEYDHYVIDNGSEDATADFLNACMDRGERIKYLRILPANVGIAKASNMALDAIRDGGYDLIIKFDNDAEIVTDRILSHIVAIYESKWRKHPYAERLMLSPRVEGIVNQPKRSREISIAKHRIGIVGQVGGLFQVVPWDVVKDYRYPDDLPLARGSDTHFCEWFKTRGGECGYIEDVVVNHYETTDGQARRYPAYFERKHREERQVPA